MKEISFDDVKALWNRCTTPVMIYVHSPFCESQCTYCVYRGTPGVPRTIESSYYNDYLPNQIRKYYPILDTLDVHSIYFGGGTSNHRGNIEQLRPAFEALKPYIDRGLKEVSIELHMGYEVTEEQIDTLREWGVTTVVLCVQTFNTDLLREKHRYNRFSMDAYWKHVDEVSGLCHKHGLYVGMDLLAFFEDFDTLRQDLSTIIYLFENPPDEVSVAPIYQNRTARNYPSAYTEIVSSLRPLYTPELSIGDNSSVKVIRSFRVPGDISHYTFRNFMDDETSAVWNTSCLGIGSYRNPDKWTFSTINNSYTITEQCMDLSEEPRYYLNRGVSFWDKCRNIIDALERECNYCDPPYDFILRVRNNPELHPYTDTRDESVYFGFDNCCDSELTKRLSDWIRGLSPEAVRDLECRPKG